MASDPALPNVPASPPRRVFPGAWCLLSLLALLLPLAAPIVWAQEASGEEAFLAEESSAFQQDQTPPAPPPRAESTPKSLNIPAPLLQPPPTVPPTVPPPFAPGQPKPPERWWLMRELQGTWIGALFDDSRFSISGWTEGSYTASTSRVSNFPVTFNDRANTFLLQQQWLRFNRALVVSGTTDPTFGYHLDVLVGSDYRWTLIRGLFNSQLDNSTGAQNLYGLDPIQFFANAYLPTLFQGTELRVGRTYNPWGYESLEAVSTPLLSRSYAFFNTPFTLMGVGAYVTFDPVWSAVFLLANGNDTFLVPYQEARMFGKITYAALNQKDNVQLGWTLGRGRFNAGAPFAPATVGLAQEPAGHNNFNAIDVVYTHIFSPVFTYANESMCAYQDAVPVNPNGGLVRFGPDTNPGTAHWASMVHYFRINYSPRVSSILRVETFDDFNGQRTGFRGLYTAVTGGVQVRLRSNAIMIRPELRYDYNSESRPFEGKHGQLLAASDLILRW